ncbi:hypothetical protein H072_4367 [Dactylellina haptotyla CBS 200.50]|uniref:Telomerase reverse transcriptase n=1 Tax=Dactylellina haptotyla (strain CBS 200.50) TaxID=1284197 RepID=S8AF93_DACHA|nr:hypothetical protein H072_4367 [Dactylellina haptotyla CBS 200.50]
MVSKKRKSVLIGPNLEYIDHRPERKRQKFEKAPRRKKGGTSARASGRSEAQASVQQPCPEILSQVPEEPPIIYHPVLSAYFKSLLPLRQYLSLAIVSSKSTATSLISRKQRLLKFKSDGSIVQNEVSRLLDTAIVGVLEPIDEVNGEDPFVEKVLAERLNATQDERFASSQDELVDCAISTLFRKARRHGTWANSILAGGYRINDNNTRLKTTQKFRQFGLDVVCLYPNPHASEFKSAAWETITKIVGQETMLKLLSMQGSKEGALFFPLSDKVRRGNGSNTSLSTKCYQQFLGSALSEIQLEKIVKTVESTEGDAEPDAEVTFSRKPKTNGSILRKPSEIRFVRSRIFYAKPGNNKYAEPKNGLRHIHVLNRFCDHTKRHHKVHVLKYIFPRAFGLHNVFTSTVNKADTVQQFKDYTLREDEINAKISLSISDRRLRRILNKDKPMDLVMGCPDDNDGLHHGYEPPPSPLPEISKDEKNAYETVENIPQRFRGKILNLVGDLIKRQRRCNYHPLLQHYCPSSVIHPNVPDPRPKVPFNISVSQQSPVASMAFKTQVSRRRSSGISRGPKDSLPGHRANDTPQGLESSEIGPEDPILLFATNSHNVYTFLRAVMGNMIPLEFWGSGSAVLGNRNVFFGHLEKFIKLRRFENLSLHDVMQGLKISDLAWLHQKEPNANGKVRLDAADMKQCSSLLAEFVYYLFDSLLIPLIRAHFYVTESASDKNRTCYFRHDIWRKLTASYTNKMISNMFTDISSRQARLVMARRAAKFSTVRFLPKKTGVRVLSNLKRRPMELDQRTGLRVLGPSINQVLKPNHVALTFEKSRQPQAVGAAMFSVGEILKKLTGFRDRLKADGLFGNQKLYFVKVDVTSCFDTIPQERLLAVVEKLYMENSYKIRKQGRVATGTGKPGEAKPKILFPQIAEPADNHLPPVEQNKKYVADTGQDKRSLIFVDRVTCTYHERAALLRELQEHVSNNFVQIGKRFYRQSIGIPQGSVVSTLLCNLFYADLETKELPFTQAKTGLLMRLIDDFLFITTNREHAKRFSDAMHRGFPEYGVVIKVEKSLVNFEVDYNGRKIERVPGSTSGFPYCGALINEKTLEMKRDWTRRDGVVFSNLLTVEYGSKPGQKMLDKLLGGWKMISSAIYLNTGFNSRPTVVTNLYWSFVDAGMKFYRYYRSVSPHGKNNRSKGKHHQVNEWQIVDIVSEFMALAYSLMMSRENREYDSTGAVIPRNGLIGRNQVRWLVAKAFLRVLRKKQTLFPRVLKWLEDCVKVNAKRVDWVFYRAVEDAEAKEVFDSVRY